MHDATEHSATKHTLARRSNCTRAPFWCSSCGCEASERPLRGQLPDTGFGNRLSKMLSFAAIGEALGRRVLTFWPTLGNTNYKKHMGRRYYGSLQELQDLVWLPSVLHFLEDGPDPDAVQAVQASNASRKSGTLFSKISLEHADTVPVEAQGHELIYGWGHPEGTWYYWNRWAASGTWPPPCVEHAAFLTHCRAVLTKLRPRIDFGNPPPRSYNVLHVRRGDRGSTAQLRKHDPQSLNLTWQNVHTITRRTGLPWLVVSDDQSELPEIKETLRSQYGARVVTLGAAASNSTSPLQAVLRDFFAMAAAAGIVFSGLRSGPWVDSTLSSMAAVVGQTPLLVPANATDRRYSYIRFLQKLSNHSGTPFPYLFMAEQVDDFTEELESCRERPYPLPLAPDGPAARHECYTNTST